MCIFSFIILKSVTRGVLYSLSTIRRYKQSVLRKKELIAFLGEHFNENTICIDFQFHNSKSQEICFYVLDRAFLNGALRKKQS